MEIQKKLIPLIGDAGGVGTAFARWSKKAGTFSTTPSIQPTSSSELADLIVATMIRMKSSNEGLFDDMKKHIDNGTLFKQAYYD